MDLFSFHNSYFASILFELIQICKLILIIVVVFASASFVFYKWYTKNLDYFEKQGIPYTNLIGAKIENIVEFVTLLYNHAPGEK